MAHFVAYDLMQCHSHPGKVGITELLQELTPITKGDPITSGTTLLK